MDSQDSQRNQEVPSTPLFGFHIISSQDSFVVPSSLTSQVNFSIGNIRELRNTNTDQGVPWTTPNEWICSSSATNEPSSQAEQRVPCMPSYLTKIEVASSPGSSYGTSNCPTPDEPPGKSRRATEQANRIAQISTWRENRYFFQDDEIFG